MLSLPTLTLPVLTPFYSARTFFVQGVPLSDLRFKRVLLQRQALMLSLPTLTLPVLTLLYFCAHISCPGGAPV